VTIGFKQQHINMPGDLPNKTSDISHDIYTINWGLKTNRSRQFGGVSQ